MLFQKGHSINKGRIPWNKGTKGVSTGGRKFEGVKIVCGLEGCNEVKKMAKSRVMKINFCKPEHFKEYQKGKKWWDEEFRKTNSGENSHKFKGIMASCSSLHHRVTYWKGRPEFCFDCGVTQKELSKDGKFLQWSNQSGLYLDDLNDFVGRCPKCHKAYDKKLGYPRKKSFDEKGRRIGITIFIPKEYLDKQNKLPPRTP